MGRYRRRPPSTFQFGSIKIKFFEAIVLILTQTHTHTLALTQNGQTFEFKYSTKEITFYDYIKRDNTKRKHTIEDGILLHSEWCIYHSQNGLNVNVRACLKLFLWLLSSLLHS